jgi:hypothetical protein
MAARPANSASSAAHYGGAKRGKRLAAAISAGAASLRSAGPQERAVLAAISFPSSVAGARVARCTYLGHRCTLVQPVRCWPLYS